MADTVPAIDRPGNLITSSLLSTKLFIPQARLLQDVLPRPRLVERLGSGLSRKLTLLSAPAGFGKTTLLTQWIPQSERCVCWISLDEADNDLTRFLTYFIAALQMLKADFGQVALATLQAPQSPPTESLITVLVNEIIQTLDQFALVLDDYHLIHLPAIHAAVAFLLNNLPPNMHLIITSRADLPLPLARLRVRGQLTELRAADLRFTLDETTTYFQQIKALPLPVAQIEELETRTEGWGAGLQLAALSLQGLDSAGIARFIRDFTGSHHYVFDYLAEEVLQQQPEEIRHFLLHTSILSRMCGPLCDAVLSRGETSSPSTSGQEVLEYLEHANLFLVPLDDRRHWYRYHHLFAELLRARLEQAYPDTVLELHRRASRWYEQQGLLAEAITLAVSAADLEQVARLVEKHGPHLTQRGQVQTVLGWLNALPEALVRSRASLCIIHAQTLMFSGRLEAADARLNDAEQCTQMNTPVNQAQAIRAQVTLLRAIIRRFYGNLAHSIALSHQALELLPEVQANLRVVALLNAARVYLVSGEVTTANERLLLEAVTQIQALGNPVAILTSLTNLARLQTLQGRLHQATITYATAAQVASGPDVLRTLIGSLAYYAGLGDLLREQNDLDQAERLLTQGLDATTQLFDADLVALCYIALARLKQARGDSAGASKILDEFAQLARQRKFFETLVAQGMAIRARLQLAQGDLAAALRWAGERDLPVEDEPSYVHELEYLTLVRVRIAEGRSHPDGSHLREALGLLAWLLPAAEAGGRIGSVIEILILRALALQMQGDPRGALITLERALTLAEPEGYVRTFVDEGAQMAALLGEAYTRAIMPTYVAKLLAAFPDFGLPLREASHPALDFGLNTTEEPKIQNPAIGTQAKSKIQNLVESLSKRELEILSLMAQGLTNIEIGQQIFISAQTVKVHTRNIYGKLGVNSRRQAVNKARALGLLIEPK